MLDVDLTARCDVLLLPVAESGEEVAWLRRGLSFFRALRFVAEDLDESLRERAVIRTRSRNIFANEAVGLHGLIAVGPDAARPVRADLASPASPRDRDEGSLRLR